MSLLCVAAGLWQCGAVHLHEYGAHCICAGKRDGAIYNPREINPKELEDYKWAS